MSKIIPKQDYLLIEVIEESSAVVKTGDIRDHDYKGKVLAVGPGVYVDGKWQANMTQVGEIVYWEEMADSNTPASLKSKKLVLVKEARLIAAETEV